MPPFVSSIQHYDDKSVYMTTYMARRRSLKFYRHICECFIGLDCQITHTLFRNVLILYF
jgi:hypothetical protein